VAFPSAIDPRLENITDVPRITRQTRKISTRVPPPMSLGRGRRKGTLLDKFNFPARKHPRFLDQGLTVFGTVASILL
jgi:hypothetical protein